MSSTITALTSGGGISMAGDTSGQLELKTNNGTTAVTVTTGQLVGVGTTSPTNTLQVAGGISATGSAPAFQASAAIIDVSAGVVRINATGADNSTNGTMTFNTASANAGVFNERMRIDSSGNVLIGGTGANGKLCVFGTNADWNINSNVAGSAGGTKLHIRFIGDSALTGSITSSGTNTSFNTSSDYRLKENIAPMTNALATVSALKPVTYKWKLDGSAGQGFIAHELQAVVPDCVTGEKDAMETYKDEDGVEQTRINPQGIDTSYLVATLTAAIQELKATVDAQALEIQALKGVA